jgi:hypothetical protein
MEVNIFSNLDEVIKGLNDLEKRQLPFAIMKATNDLAFDYWDKQKKEVAGQLSWKNAKAPNTIRILKATKQKPYADVFADESHWGYYALMQHFNGGDRHRKGLEKRMIAKGYMYKWEILTPSPGVKVPMGIYNQIIAQLKIDDEVGYLANETKRSKKRNIAKNKSRYFIITGKSKSQLAPGIYARIPGAESPVCMLRISEKPEYIKKFDMETTLLKVYDRRGNEYFKKALDYAISTAK